MTERIPVISYLEALLALERTGTISEAAAQLRLTQSAVTKRIQALQNEVQFKVIEPDGRRVRLTSMGQSLLDKARPLISEIKNLKDIQTENTMTTFSIGISDSIASSWGPRLIRLATKKEKNLILNIHVHRSTLVEENVKLGRYHLGLCVSPTVDKQLVSETISEESMVLLSNRFDSESETKKIITIEPNSATWKVIQEKALKHPKIKNYELVYVESFAAIVQMVKEGFGHGLVPIGVALTMGAPKKAIHLLLPSIKREIKLISRKNISLLPAIQSLVVSLKETSKELF
ncbi:MAG: LysR family transcriptional regulator [Moraxellaceae bacterium]|nr:LysR family transcriptional regulator [Pseudobdellovibrionaceae bacterium]